MSFTISDTVNIESRLELLTRSPFSPVIANTRQRIRSFKVWPIPGAEIEEMSVRSEENSSHTKVVASRIEENNIGAVC